MNTSHIIILCISCLIVGFISGIGLIIGTTKYKNYKADQRILSQFTSIFINIKSLKFKQRIQNYVYFTFKKLTVIYVIDKEDVMIFEGDDCIASSTQIKRDKTFELIKKIKTKFNKEINDDIVRLGDYIMSKGYYDSIVKTNSTSVEQNTSDVDKILDDNESKLSLDDILDKINKKGINGLTDEEIKFLNSFK